MLKNRIIFFFGWLLSPLTFWNDIFVNIPLAYVLASATILFIPVDFLLLTIIYYWLTNILGLALMVVSGKRIFRDRKSAIRELAILVATIAVYSAILVTIHAIGILRPLHIN